MKTLNAMCIRHKDCHTPGSFRQGWKSLKAGGKLMSQQYRSSRKWKCSASLLACIATVPFRTWFFPSKQESHTHNNPPSYQLITLRYVFRGRMKGFSDTLKALEQSLSSSMKTESSLQTDEPLLLLEVTLKQRLMYLKPQSP